MKKLLSSWSSVNVEFTQKVDGQRADNSQNRPSSQSHAYVIFREENVKMHMRFGKI